MAMSKQLRVDPDLLHSAATNIESQRLEYVSGHEMIRTEAANLVGMWKGPASAAFKARIDSFENDLISMNNLLEAYVEFLKNGAANYQNNENEIINIMSSLDHGV